MINFPNAKINIGLNITEKRPDGFHNIETIFYPIGLSDILEINHSTNGFQYLNSGLTVEDGKLKNNLCYKAFEILKKDFPIPDINLHLHKIIPFGSGLGGGSSDASFTLKMLNLLFKLNLTNSDLVKYAEQIGSDCAIFIENKTAFATERGNILNPLNINLSGMTFVLIHPGIHVNTGLAYSKSNPRIPKKKLTELIKEPIENWKSTIFNDFEEIIFHDHPEIKEIKDQLYNLGAVYASMSGSGSSVYGLFKNNIDINNVFDTYYTWKEIL
ncbi:MAG: 4-(cytidine 5'-diphospho)-2-C-methyl-D-erythritol kinase [Bacteroidales bacterium]|nr:4-(cytidine 5'-diphospho)-2-C-methyl-D-erythritol kinase [Bacteroidales bacterium]